MNKKLLLILFSLLGLGLGLGLAIFTYGYGYGYWQSIMWQGVLAYGPLGLVLGVWHGWLAGQGWRMWKKVGMALIGDIALTILVAVVEDTGINHLALGASLVAAEIALTYKWTGAVCGMLLACVLITHRTVPGSPPVETE